MILKHFADHWDIIFIPKEDIAPMGKPHLGAQSLDAAGALSLTLHYLSSAMLETHLQQIFALVLSVLSHYLTFFKTILLDTLWNMNDAAINLPKTIEEFHSNSVLISSHHPLLHGTFRSIDRLSLPAQESNDLEIENATNTWTGL